MDAERIEVLHVADSDTIVERVTHHFILHLFPALETLLDKHLRRERESLLGQGGELLGVVAESGSETAERVGRAEYDGIAEFRGCLECVLLVVAGHRVNGLDIDFIEFIDEDLAVFGINDRLDGSAEHLEVIFVEYALVEKLDTAVESGLAAEREHDSLRTFAGYHLLDKERGDGQEVDMVGDSLGSLHCRDIGIDEHCLYTLLAECLECLASRIVEFSGLADLERARTEHEYFLYIAVF